MGEKHLKLAKENLVNGIKLYGTACHRCIFAGWKETIFTFTPHGNCFYLWAFTIYATLITLITIIARVVLFVTTPISAFIVLESDRQLALNKKRASEKLDAQFADNRNH
jgi:hypothetical protein